MSKIGAMFRHQTVLVIVTAGVVFLVIVFVRWAGLLEWLELQAYDVFLRARASDPAAEQRIVIVGAGEEEIERLGWPLSDEILADLLDRLVGLEPAVVGVDIYRDRPVDAGAERLADLLTAHEEIIWVSKFSVEASSGVSPPAVLLDTDQTGFADIIPDPGGTVRRGVLFLDDGVNFDFSFSLRLALRYLAFRDVFPEPGEPDPSHFKLGSITVPPFEANDGGYIHADSRGYQYLLDFRHGPPTYPTISLGEALNGGLTPELIRGQIVLVGVMAESVKDFFYTPFSQGSEQMTFGVELHGEMTHQIIRHALKASPTTRSLTEGQEAGWILLWTLLGALIAGWVRSVLWFTLALTTGVAGLTTASYAAFVMSWWLPVVPAALGTASMTLTFVMLLGYRFTIVDKDKRLIKKAFSHYLAPSVVDRLVADGRMPTLGGELRELTVWISDLENYTTYSELLPPTELVDLLNTVYTRIGDTVEEHDGFVAQFVGDAVVAAFGAPLHDPDHARHAVESAMACSRRVAELASQMTLPDGLRLHIRIGISTGVLLVGNIGSKRRLSYTLVGDDINLASRLEGVNKIYGSTILVNETTVRQCESNLRFREVDVVQVKGRAAPVRIFEPLGRPESISADQGRDLAAFAEALTRFRARQFVEAMAGFEALAERDPVAAAFAARARELNANPPPENWEGVNVLFTK